MVLKYWLRVGGEQQREQAFFRLRFANRACKQKKRNNFSFRFEEQIILAFKLQINRRVLAFELQIKLYYDAFLFIF